MELFSNLALGFATASTLTNLGFCLIGVLLGTLIGVLPGIGATATIAMLLPLTYQIGDPVTSLIMLAGIYYGAQYGGSTTAILVNMPGESSSAVTAIDGYQMARKGRAGPALAIAAIGSFFAGTVATMIVAVLAIPLIAYALKFSTAETFALMVLGLILAVALASGSVLKALAMVVLGVMLGLVGSDTISGDVRFAFGIPELYEGFNFVAVAVGLFGVAEILRNLENERGRDTNIAKVGSLYPSRTEWKQMAWPSVRGTALGSALGVLPGGGAILASFASYTMEKKVSKNPKEFGQGAVAGVAGPESANNAAAQTSFIPLLTLGIPANPVMALMIGAMIIKGVIPGPNVATENPSLFWGLIASMWIGNLMLVILNLPLVGLWVKLLTVPYYILFPLIMAFCAIGVYSVNSNVYDLYTVAGFGLLGYILMKLRCEPAPLLLGFVLGDQLEENLRQSMIKAFGDPWVMLSRPITATVLIIALLVLIATFLPAIRKKREEVFVEEE
ncbi:MAG: tripartite tricarboxylate transporter permease [Mesorhizobium sp.]